MSIEREIRERAHISTCTLLMGDFNAHTQGIVGFAEKESTNDYIVSDRKLYGKEEYMYVHNSILSDHCLLSVSLLISLGPMPTHRNGIKF